MKRLLSIICALLLMLGVVVLPTGVIADSVTELSESYLHHVTKTQVGGEDIYTTNTWDAGSITFDYKIESGYRYYLSFNYMGKATSAAQIPMATTVDSKTKYLNDVVANPVTLNIAESTSSYSTVWTEISGDDLLKNGGEYLIINWKHLTSVSKFKNFKVVKLKEEKDAPKVSFMHNVKANLVDGEMVYTSGTWNAGSITFDYEIESDYTYFLSFDFKGHNYANRQKPSASTVATTTTKINDAVSSAVNLAVPSSKTAWTNVSVELKAADLLASGGKYLAINWVHVDPAGNYKNFKIQRVKLADDGYLHPVTLKKGEVNKSFENGEIIYALKEWASPSMVFDYELEAGKEYKFEFEYKGHSWAQTCVPSIMAATSLSYQTGGEKPAYIVPLGITSTKTGYTKFECIFEADSLMTGGGKYFTVFAMNLSEKGYFKNMKLSVNASSDLVGEQPLKVATLKTGGEVESSDDGGTTVYTFAKAWCTPSITFDFRMKPGKTYAVNFDYTLSCDFFGNSKLNPSFTAVSAKNQMGSKVYDKNVDAGLVKTNEWINKTVIITADDIITDKERFLMFYAVNPTAPNGLRAKNFTIAEIDPNELLSNGTFESGMTFWKNADGTAKITEDAVQGKFAVNLKGGNYSLLTHNVALEVNKNYKLTFQYKGKFYGLPNWGIAKGAASMEPASLMHYGKLTDTDEWKEQSVVFSTGEDNAFAIMFQTGAGCDFYIDNVVIEETTEEAAEVYESGAPKYTENESVNRFWHWDAEYDEEEGKDYNLIVNGSFDGEGGNWDSLLANGTISHVEHDDAKSGNKVLKFEAQGLSELSYNYLYIPCTPNTEYMISVWHKGEPWSDTNKNDLRWGIADPITGKLTFTYRTSLRGWNINAWDNEWHRSTLKFDSGNNDVIALLYVGGNSVVYIDDLQVFEYAHKENSRPLVMVQEQPTVTDYLTVKDNIACDEEDNIFENAKFDKKDISFWNGEDSLGYMGTISENYITLLDWDGTAEIANSQSSHGKALHYKEQTKYTGAPLSTSYLKYVSVEPDTEYTFVADFRVDKEGKGRFGLVSVNDFYPRIIGEWKNFADENFDTDHNWQTYAYTFNTNGFDRLAFVIQDKGGEAYIDNIRLFKTSAGKPQKQTIYKVESDKYDIKNGMFTVEEGDTVGDVLKTLKNKSKIRVFDKDGNEINDKNKLVGTGTKFKHMDGISALDTVTAILYGDVTCDGKVNKGDTKAVLRHILGTEIIFDIGQTAGDLNSDGEIDLKDVSIISGAKAQKLGDATAVFEGPAEVPANNEFEVTYSLKGINIYAADGVINYNPENLTFVSLDAEIGSDWVVQYSEEDGSIKFAMADSTGKKAINGKTAMFTVTFKTGNNAGDTAALSVTDQTATAGKNLLKLKDIGYTAKAEEKTESKPTEKPVIDNTQNQTNTEIQNNTQNNDYNSGVIITEDEGPSNNNRLASLIVKNAEITPEFDPETKNYEATVPFEIEELIVEAVAADENATVEISDTKLIYVGKNITRIVVHSESGLQRTYKIYTTREAPAKGGKKVITISTGLPVWGWILIGVGAAAVIAAGIFVLIIFTKRKGEKK